MTLLERQILFTVMTGELIRWCYQEGFDITYGETLRSKEEAKRNANNGSGISNSLHIIGLAVDFKLFKNGIYLKELKDYEPLGVFWESIGGSWGGRFKRPDADHFSLSYNGVR